MGDGRNPILGFVKNDLERKYAFAFDMSFQSTELPLEDRQATGQVLGHDSQLG